MASGKVQVDGNKISYEPGTTHTENEIALGDSKLSVTSPSGTTDFDVTEEGYYILNIKPDTLVGSQQQLGGDNSQQVISQENLRVRIDSIQQLMSGNASSEKKNFNIPPNRISKISSVKEVLVVGPYKKMPSSVQGGSSLEVFKVYTNKEMREIVGNLQKMVSDTTSSE